MRLTSPLLARQEGSGVQTKPATRSFIAISSLLCSGFLDPSDVLKECLKMKVFIHPNVMGILDICLDDQASYIWLDSLHFNVIVMVKLCSWHC